MKYKLLTYLQLRFILQFSYIKISSLRTTMEHILINCNRRLYPKRQTERKCVQQHFPPTMQEPPNNWTFAAQLYIANSQFGQGWPV